MCSVTSPFLFLVSHLFIFPHIFLPHHDSLKCNYDAGTLVIIRGGVTEVLLSAQLDISSPDDETRRKKVQIV